MTTFAASVTIVDLPAGTTVTGNELFEAVQTSNSVGQSVQLSLTQMLSLPSANSFVKTVGTSLATTGTTTAIVAFVANAGIGSTQLGALAVQQSNITSGAVGSTQLGALAVQQSNITSGAVGSTQLANNAVGTAQLATSIGLTGTLSVIGTASFSGGIVATGTLNQVGTSILTGVFNVVGTTLFTSAFGVVGTTQFTSSFNVNGTANFTSTFFNVVGTATFTSDFNVIGSATFTSNVFQVIGTTQFTSNIFGVVGTSIFTGSLVLASQSSGVANFLQVSATGVVGTASPNFVLLNTLLPNNVASTNDTSSFTSTYRNYLVMFDNVCPATQTTTLQITLATSGSAFTTSGYVSIAQINVSSVLVTDTSTAALLLTGTRSTTQLQTSTVNGVNGYIRLFNPSGSVANKALEGRVTYPTPGALGTTTLAMSVVNGMFSNASPVTGINFAFNSGNIQTGTIRIYGMT